MSSDSLVLKFVEYEAGAPKKTIDTVVYVFYDFLKSAYCIRGKRTNVKNHVFKDFSFYCDTEDYVLDFISFIVSSNTFSVVLKNFKNLPIESDNITYKLLSKLDNKIREDEISGYDNVFISCSKDDELTELADKNKRQLIKTLNMIKNVYNPYFPDEESDDYEDDDEF